MGEVEPVHSMYQLPNYVPRNLDVAPKAKVINFIGQAGAGKSSHAASLFAHMKVQGYNVELISEYAKAMVWRESTGMLNNQVYILAKQYEQQERLRDKVDYIITDSPLLLNYYYNRGKVKSLEPLVYELWDSFDNIMFYVERTKPYVALGRYQTENEADLDGIAIRRMIDASGEPYRVIKSLPDTSSETVLNMIHNPFINAL